MKTVHYFLQEAKAEALPPWKSAAVSHTRHRWKAVGQKWQTGFGKAATE